MVLVLIIGGFLLLVVVVFLYEFLTDSSAIDEDAVFDVKFESEDDREQVLIEHEREVAEATRADIEDGYSGQ